MDMSPNMYDMVGGVVRYNVISALLLLLLLYIIIKMIS